MVESIGTRLGNTGAVTEVAAPTATPPVQSAAQSVVRVPTMAPQSTSSVQLSGIAQTLSSTAPVDYERVARIRKAIEDGNFPILPTTIADQMIALRMNWVARDEA